MSELRLGFGLVLLMIRIVESLVILEYIDEIWKENTHLMPSKPYERAQARFWASFIDDKIFPTTRKLVWSRGDDVEKAKEELEEMLKMFEKGIEGKGLVGGSKIVYLDLVALLVYFWIPILQESIGQQVLTREKFPGIYSWSDVLLGHPFMKENLPNRDDFVTSFRARFSLSS
ncbi:hypothetical protein RND81_06G024100 [Saponaria officinalis]|uniref:glutathione transferase n=1 Tax=Saponaria officinalis TaxID=3572 RepID=A0AAW1K685_SAPOF